MEMSLDSRPIEIPDRMYFRIGDVADLVGVKPYVLRYWETEFPVLSPTKTQAGHRLYRRTDVESLLLIKHLLYTERYSIEGARNRIRELRRKGEWSQYKRQKVLGGEAHLAQKDRLAKAKGLISEIRDLAKVPVHEFYKL